MNEWNETHRHFCSHLSQYYKLNDVIGKPLGEKITNLFSLQFVCLSEISNWWLLSSVTTTTKKTCLFAIFFSSSYIYRQLTYTGDMNKNREWEFNWIMFFDKNLEGLPDDDEWLVGFFLLGKNIEFSLNWTDDAYIV